jgi:hypothetical protein
MDELRGAKVAVARPQQNSDLGIYGFERKSIQDRAGGIYIRPL